MNNILIVFYTDGTKDVFSFAQSKSIDQALAECQGSFVDKEIRKHFYILNSHMGSSIFKNYASLSEKEELVVENKEMIIDKHIESIRIIRNNLLKNLDIEFIKSLEFESEDLKEHIKKVKNHLRNIPGIALQHMREMDQDKLSKYNAFGNIYGAGVAHAGVGYKNAPEVHIEPPTGQYEGAQAKAVAFIDGDKVVKIEIIDPGAGYTKTPKLKIDPPEDGVPAFGVCSAPENLHPSIAPTEAEITIYS